MIDGVVFVARGAPSRSKEHVQSEFADIVQEEREAVRALKLSKGRRPTGVSPDVVASTSGGKRGGVDSRGASDPLKKAKAINVSSGGLSYDDVDSAARRSFDPARGLWDDAVGVDRYLCDTGHLLDVRRLRDMSPDTFKRESNLSRYRVCVFLACDTVQTD